MDFPIGPSPVAPYCGNGRPLELIFSILGNSPPGIPSGNELIWLCVYTQHIFLPVHGQSIVGLVVIYDERGPTPVVRAILARISEPTWVGPGILAHHLAVLVLGSLS